MSTPALKFQFVRPEQPNPRSYDRTDHVWFVCGGLYKCCLCGAVCFEPPPYPTPPKWMPSAFEELTDEERALCPRSAGIQTGGR